MCFDTLCFAQTPAIQPVEHAACFAFGPAYLDVTRKHIRPCPGKEAAYAKVYGELNRIAGAEGMIVEPPSGHDPHLSGE